MNAKRSSALIVFQWRNCTKKKKKMSEFKLTLNYKHDQEIVLSVFKTHTFTQATMYILHIGDGGLYYNMCVVSRQFLVKLNTKHKGIADIYRQRAVFKRTVFYINHVVCCGLS